MSGIGIKASTSTAWNAELYEARHGFVWQFGQGVFELLAPQRGERILDLGCGTGQLTEKIAVSGANVLGLDSSPEMIAQARQNYPKLQFVLQDAAAMTFSDEFDAVFSNAALHWMLDAERVAQGMARALRAGGRLIAELGGKGNIARIESALRDVLPRHYGANVPRSRTFFPSVGEYSAILESHGLEVRMAELFDRPTPLEGADGMENWLRQFSWYHFEVLEKGARERALAEVVEALRPSLFGENGWWADYRRLRVVAVKM